MERVRVIRDTVLATEDGVERIKVTVDGAEHNAWLVGGQGWHAIVSNLWDLHVASSLARAERTNERENVITYEFLEVVVEDETVLSFAYEIGGGEEHLFDFHPGSWEAAFGLRRAA